jgi:hypothetical protein
LVQDRRGTVRGMTLYHESFHEAAKPDTRSVATSNRRWSAVGAPAGFEPAPQPPETGRFHDRGGLSASYLVLLFASCVCGDLLGAVVRSTRHSTTSVLKDQLEALVLGRAHRATSLRRTAATGSARPCVSLSVASPGETGAFLRPACDVVLRAGRGLLDGRGGGRERPGLAGSSELREHFGQAPIVLSGYPAGNDVVDQLIVGEYLQEELAEVGR